MNEFLCSLSSVIRWAWLQSTERMTYLYHRWEQAFGKDGSDLSLWIMILLILHNSITSWAGAAKITTHQATTVTPQVSSKEKLENSQRWQVWREVSWPYLCYTWDPSTGPAGLQAPTTSWCSVSTHGNSCTMTKVALAHLSLSLSPTGSQQLGALAGPDPESEGFDHLYILSRQPWATVQ